MAPLHVREHLGCGDQAEGIFEAPVFKSLFDTLPAAGRVPQTLRTTRVQRCPASRAAPQGPSMPVEALPPALPTARQARGCGAPGRGDCRAVLPGALFVPRALRG